jgi:hypothetical protein
MKTTYLYAKQHSVTGLRYFGKTIRDPYKYNGSGLKWKYHCNKHGWEHVVTTWVQAYTDKQLLTEEALFYSKVYNIVDSDKWANIIPEDGLGGGSLKGHSKPTLKGQKRPEHSAVMKLKMSGPGNAMYGKTPWNKGLDKSDPRVVKNNTNTKYKGQPGELNGMYGKHMTLTCPHCNKTGGRMMLRWHFDHCRSKV